MTQKNEPAAYPYSKMVSYILTATITGGIAWTIPGLLKFLKAKDVESCLLIAAFELALVIMLFVVIIKYTIPAWQNKIALELNDTELISYTRNVTIPWNAIQDIDIRKGKSSSWLYIIFKVDSDYGFDYRIPLQFVKGSDDAILKAIRMYKF